MWDSDSEVVHLMFPFLKYSLNYLKGMKAACLFPAFSFKKKLYSYLLCLQLYTTSEKPKDIDILASFNMYFGILFLQQGTFWECFEPEWEFYMLLYAFLIYRLSKSALYLKMQSSKNRKKTVLWTIVKWGLKVFLPHP